MSVTYIVCVPWKLRAPIPCVIRTCAHCEIRVALEAGNMRRRDLVPLCPGCANELFPDLSPEDAIGLVGGIEYRDLETAKRAAMALLERN